MKFIPRVIDRCLFEAHWRCEEPVLVIESDDWGLHRVPCYDLVARYGEPTDWAFEQTESHEDLAALYRLLSLYRDSSGRPACMTANFVVSNADYKATAAGNYDEYVERPIDSTIPESTLKAYREGMNFDCFYPQYHGLRHLAADSLLRDLRAAHSGSRALFENGCGPALTLIKGHGWRYHSEYLDWSSGASNEPQIYEAVRAGTAIFERTFGFRSKSTIAPHYVLSKAAFKAWADAGIRYVQGCNYQVYRDSNGNKQIHSTYLGQPGPHGLNFLARTVKFEPRPGRSETALNAIAQARGMLDAGIPAVVDTHRINYTGIFRAKALTALGELLDAVCRYRPQFLTTEELGEAICNGGAFRDVFSGELRTLRVAKSKFASACRMAVESLWAPSLSVQ